MGEILTLLPPLPLLLPCVHSNSLKSAMFKTVGPAYAACNKTSKCIGVYVKVSTDTC